MRYVIACAIVVSLALWAGVAWMLYAVGGWRLSMLGITFGAVICFLVLYGVSASAVEDEGGYYGDET